MGNVVLKKQKPSLRLWNEDTVKWEHGGKRYCLLVQLDDMAESPREWDNLTIMACFHRRYNLGDEISAKDPEEFWLGLVKDNVPLDEVITAAKTGVFEGIELKDSTLGEGLYDLYLRDRLDLYEGIRRDDVMDYVTDELTIGQLQTLLEPYAEWMPLWLYDHSGLTISCGVRAYPYNDRWDSGQVGWIVALKDTIISETREILRDENGEPIREEYKHPNGTSTWGVKSRPLTDETWRKRAVEIMKSDVELYDLYLRGEVYGFKLYEYDAEEDDWNLNEIDSCWGFYGEDVLENGIAEQAGLGLAEAIKTGNYEQGEAKKHTRTYYTF